MAEDGGQDRDTEDLSEEASPYKVEELRRQGKVVQSRELAAVFVLAVGGVLLYAMSSQLYGQMTEYMKDVFRTDLSARMNLSDPDQLLNAVGRGAKILALLAAPIMGAGFLAGIVGSVSQIGFLFSSEPLTPDLERINPISGVQRLFSLRTAKEALRIFAKTVVIGVVAYLALKPEVLTSARLIFVSPDRLPSEMAAAARVVFASLLGVVLVFAGIDFWSQRQEYGKQVRLTKQEAKQEQKEREGDPIIKARIRSIQREVARRRMMQAVKKANVIVTNPTHIAIALQYDRDGMAAPKVVAKGADFVAQKIKKLAADEGIPIVENVPLARTLYKTVKVGQFIPRSLYQAVAEVLAYVYRLRGKI